MKYVIVLVLAALLIRYLFRKPKVPRASKPATEVLRQDPVCGVYVQEHKDLSLATGSGRVYFCSKECMSKFQERTPS
jgi:YHS domain-containing protein